MMASNLVSLLALFVAIYGLCYMFGGRPLADRFARWLSRRVQAAVTAVGRATARLVNEFPLFFGALVIILMIMALTKM